MKIRSSMYKRHPDVIVQANPQFRVVSTPDRIVQILIGLHGWEPEFADMHGIFIASGPRLPAGLNINAIRAVDVYPLMMEILGIPLEMPIDGDTEALTGLLQD